MVGRRRWVRVVHLRFARAVGLVAVPGVLAVALAVAPAGQAAAAEPEPSISSTVGRLISSNHACTATVVTSNSGSVAVTAAHCVYHGGGWHLDDARFVPGYHDGRAPYGQWTVQRAWVPTAWQRGGGRTTDGVDAPVHDVAFLQLAPDEQGRSAQSVLGSQGISFDTGPGRPVTVLGYPGERGFDGERLVSCPGTAEPFAREAEGTVAGVACRSAEGASGGPWLSASGSVVAVTDSGTSSGEHWVYGHLFDADTERLYRDADAS